jgi:DNA polymerase III delta prime subunit
MSSKLDINEIQKQTFSQAATYFGGLFRNNEDASQLAEHLVNELKTLGSSEDFVKDAQKVEYHFKLGLGMGIYVASRSDERQIQSCLETFKALLLSAPNCLSKPSRLLLLTELCYMDQFTAGETRKWINREFVMLLQRHAWSPAIRDYLAASEKAKAFVGQKQFAGIKRDASSPRLFLIISGKGGSGKSTTAAALAHHLLSQNKTVGIIDLDESGPSTQYAFSIKEVIDGMGEVPNDGHQSNTEWCYPTFLDVLNAAKDHTGNDKSERMKAAAKRSIVSSLDHSNLYCVLLPESPTFCAEVADAWGRNYSIEIIHCLEECVAALADKGCQHIILDFAPGLYGTNGAVIKWLSVHYRCSPIVLTSPRVSDIAVSVYETPWLAATHEFEWATPLLHIVNRWQQSDPCGEVIAKWADHAVSSAIKASVDPSHRASSATQIHSKRFWPIMYLIALDSTDEDTDAFFEPSHVLTHLPEDNYVRLLTTLDSVVSGHSDLKIEKSALEKTTWYKMLVERVTKYLTLKEHGHSLL